MSLPKIYPLEQTDLPALTIAQARISNCLYRSGQIVGNSLVWQWTQHRAATELYRIRLRRGNEQMAVQLYDDIPALGRHICDWRELNDDMQMLAWTVAHEAFLELIHLVFGGDWVPLDLSRSDLAIPCLPGRQASVESELFTESAGFRITSECTPMLATGAVLFSMNTARRLLDRTQNTSKSTQQETCKTHSLAWSGALVELRCVLERIPINALGMSALTPGSFILLRQDPRRWGESIQVLAEGVLFNCVLTGRQLNVMSIRQSDSTLLNKNADEVDMIEPNDVEGFPTDTKLQSVTPADDSAQVLAGVCVELSLEAGRFKLPLRELQTIRPGYVFRLERPISDDLIRILVNGETVACGELVSVGDFVAVRVSHVGRDQFQSTETPHAKELTESRP